jgi:hypothetical protein
VPTGIPSNGSTGGSVELNRASNTLNIYVPGAGWYHVTLTGGAG